MDWVNAICSTCCHQHLWQFILEANVSETLWNPVLMYLRLQRKIPQQNSALICSQQLPKDMFKLSEKAEMVGLREVFFLSSCREFSKNTFSDLCLRYLNTECVLFMNFFRQYNTDMSCCNHCCKSVFHQVQIIYGLLCFKHLTSDFQIRKLFLSTYQTNVHTFKVFWNDLESHIKKVRRETFIYST